MAVPRSRNVGVFSALQAELMPFPGRFTGSLRDTLTLVIALVTAMTLRVPGIGLSLSLLFLMQRERPAVTLRSALEMISGCMTACAATLFWVQLTDGTEVLRYLGMMIGIFIAAFGMGTTSVPLFFTVFGLFGYLDLGAWDAHRSPNVLVSINLYSIAALSIVLTSAVAVEYLFGSRHPAEELDREMQKRLSVLARFFHLLAEEPANHDPEQFRAVHRSVIQLAHAGESRLNQLYQRVRDGSTLVKVPLGLHYRIGLISRVLEKSAVIGFDTVRHQDPFDRNYYAAIAAQCDALLDANKDSGAQRVLEPREPASSQGLLDIQTELAQYAASLESPAETASRAAALRAPLASSFRLFRPDAFTAAMPTLYALKLTLAATICYTIYNAIKWPEILLSVITALFTGLSPTGQMKQRQLFRFFGTAVGGAIAIAAEALLFPNMDSITALALVAGAVAFLSAWVIRSPHMGPAGTQIGFAFFLTTLQGFRATTGISTARDRLIGVTLGVVVMWFIFDQMWPTRTSHALTQILRRVRSAAQQLQKTERQRNPTHFARTLSQLRVTVSQDLAAVQQLESGVYFDFGPDHARELAQSRRIISKIETAASEFYTEALRQENGSVLQKD
jgi:multidrug resistance protein MdtO